MFESAHHALQFAFGTLGKPIIKMSSINKMRGAAGNGDMTPHDRHAQAAIIMSVIEKAVDPGGMAYLLAHYGNELRGGDKERAVADVLVRAAMAAMPTGMHSRRGVEKLVRIYFGQDISMVSVRKDMGCGHPRANEYRDTVRKALNAIGDRADYDADAALRAACLVGEEVVVA